MPDLRTQPLRSSISFYLTHQAVLRCDDVAVRTRSTCRGTEPVLDPLSSGAVGVILQISKLGELKSYRGLPAESP